MDLAPDFDEFIGSLIAHEVRFLIVGAYALAFHGAPRFTGDLDVLVEPTVDNGRRLLAAVEAFGFPTMALRAEDIAAGIKIIQMGVEPVQIHVMSSLTGVTWDEAWAGRQQDQCGRHEVSFIGRGAFLKNKRAAGRLKDLADVEALTPGPDDVEP